LTGTPSFRAAADCDRFPRHSLKIAESRVKGFASRGILSCALTVDLSIAQKHPPLEDARQALFSYQTARPGARGKMSEPIHVEYGNGFSGVIGTATFFNLRSDTRCASEMTCSA
jgi:hypothetical protein